MAPTERCDEARRVVMVQQGEGCQVQACDPAFGARLQERALLCRKGESHHLHEVGGGFLLRELQIGRPQFHQGILSAQPGQWERRVFASRQHEVNLGEQMVQQEGEGVMDRRSSNHLVILQDEDEVVLLNDLDSGFVEQHRQHSFQRWGVQRVE